MVPRRSPPCSSPSRRGAATGAAPAWIAGLLCVFALGRVRPQDGQAANFEIFMLPAMTAAVLLARRGRAMSAGAAVAVATLAKQTGALTLLPVLYLAWQRARAARRRRRARRVPLPLALVAAGIGAAPALLLDRARQRFVRQPRDRVDGRAVDVRAHDARLGRRATSRSSGGSPCVARASRRRARRRHRSRPVALARVGVISVMVGLRFFGHYYLQLIPPLCLLTAAALSKATADASPSARSCSLRCFAIAFSAAGYFMRPFGPEPSTRR